MGEHTLRVLVTSTPGAGHIHPMVPLVTALAAAGHEVLWATAPEGCARVERCGFDAVRAGIGTEERRRLFRERVPDVDVLPPRERRHALLPGLFGDVAAPRMRDELVAIFDEYRPEVVVHDLAELAAAPLATVRGVPHVTVGFSGALSGPLMEALVASVSDLWAADGLVVSESAGLYDYLYLHPFPASLGIPQTNPRARPMRPMHFDGATGAQRPEWVDAFGRDRPGCYVTFGTEPLVRPPWSPLLEALGDLDVDAVVTLGSRPDPFDAGSTPGNVRVEQYVPQTFLLDRARAVVSHAGAGTMLAAAGHGVPQLCLPMSADQWENADAVSTAGAAITLEVNQRDAATIRATLEQLLHEESIHAAARQIARDIDALPHPREHVGTIEALASPS